MFELRFVGSGCNAMEAANGPAVLLLLLLLLLSRAKRYAWRDRDDERDRTEERGGGRGPAYEWVMLSDESAAAAMLIQMQLERT